jgi:signal transduction histidine kinase
MERQRAFTAEASHELRTPLTMLKTELELMARDRPTGAELAGSIEASVEEADRLTRLIDDLLVVARSDVDRLAMRLEEVPVSGLLASVRSRYEPAGEGGTGLGLAIVRAIARGHGGDAHIARGPDGGADVWLAIPAGTSRSNARFQAPFRATRP